MKLKKITPVLLAGGIGSRLWPLSRQSLPKQFLSLFNNYTLYQNTAIRFKDSKLASFSNPIVMTSEHFRFLAEKQLKDIDVLPKKIVLEPNQKNTAPTILAACILAMEEDTDAILLAVPTDHVIKNNSEFHSAIATAHEFLDEGKLVTFGIQPKNAHTGYGYLEKKDILSSKTFSIKQFVEKPVLKRAQEMLKTNNFMWNSGMFLFRAKDMFDLFTNHYSTDIKHVQESISFAQSDLGFIRLAAEPWNKCLSISIDHAIMEKASNIVGVELNGSWSDLGDLKTLFEEMTLDDRGNTISTNASIIDCENVAVKSDSEKIHVAALGIRDTIVVATKDSVLVADKSQTSNMSKVVKILLDKKIPQAKEGLKDYRPWGWFESIAMGNRFQVKCIHVYPGEAPSLQSHNHRSEHWVVVEGTAIVTIGDKKTMLSENESIYIPLGAIHRMENPGKVPLVLIEVQTGSYLKEDDIIRYEDKYARQ